MPRSSRASRSRAQYRRRDVPPAAPAPAITGTATVPPPRVTAPAQRADTPVTTKITTTDYGYVIGELRRIAILTALIVVLLAGFWLVVG